MQSDYTLRMLALTALMYLRQDATNVGIGAGHTQFCGTSIVLKAISGAFLLVTANETVAGKA
jgi:hypothetical protein